MSEIEPAGKLDTGTADPGVLLKLHQLRTRRPAAAAEIEELWPTTLRAIRKGSDPTTSSIRTASATVPLYEAVKILERELDALLALEGEADARG